MGVSLSDEELVERVLAKPTNKDFDILYHRYHSKVINKCYSLLKDRNEAEEFAKDILSKVYERLPTFQKKSSFSTWLYSITYNHCIDYLRRRKKMHYPNWDKEQELLEIPDEEIDLEEISYESLLPILEKIHPEEKAILFMKYMDNLSLKQISQALSISETATKMRLKRARTRVLFLYEKHHHH